MIRIAMVEDHLLFRQGLKNLLQEETDFSVVFETESGEEFEQMYIGNNVDIILMDLRLKGQSGAVTCQKLYAKNKNVKVIVLSFEKNQDFMIEMVKCGASGYLTKDECISKVKLAIRHVYQHGKYFDYDLGEIFRNEMMKIHKRVRYGDFFGVEFTEEEIQITELSANQLSNKEIAEKMDLCERSIDKHKAKLLLKTNNRFFIGVIVYMISRRIIFPENLNSQFYLESSPS